MSRVAIIGGDDRVLGGDWGDDVRPFTGDDSGRLVKAAQAGTVRGVIALSKWMHGTLKNGLRSLPHNVKVVFYPGSINSLRDEYKKLIAENFAPAPPPPNGAHPQRAFRPTIADAVATKARPEPKPEPVYVDYRGDAMDQKFVSRAMDLKRTVHGHMELWTKEEHDALVLAREEAVKIYPGNSNREAWPKTMELFHHLGGSKSRSRDSVQARWYKVAATRAEDDARAKRSATAKQGAATRAANKLAAVVSFDVAAPAALVHVPSVVVPGASRGARRSALVRILEHVREGVELGLTTKERAFDDVCAQLDKLLAAEET